MTNLNCMLPITHETYMEISAKALDGLRRLDKSEEWWQERLKGWAQEYWDHQTSSGWGVLLRIFCKRPVRFSDLGRDASGVVRLREKMDYLFRCYQHINRTREALQGTQTGLLVSLEYWEGLQLLAKGQSTPFKVSDDWWKLDPRPLGSI